MQPDPFIGHHNEGYERCYVELRCDSCHTRESREYPAGCAGGVFGPDVTHICINCGTEMVPLRYYTTQEEII